ncbi:MAG: glutamate-1-semialdehyde-2,1-aminomutase [Deltaproteobacteria bacterium]|nr:glutamate-1-semialdehyde-2,1-aminomutase [Deltaproteobacteria bacterium]
MQNASSKLTARAIDVIPGGVNSPVRAWKAVGGNPCFVNRARGAYLWDADDNCYVDLVCEWGPLIAGHAHPEVLRAVTEAATRGLGFGAPTAIEVQLAEHIVDAVPSIQKVRLVTSGTEATMTAIRIARAATKRDRIVKLAGCYHGHSDPLLVRAGSGAATFGIPDSAGVPAEISRLTSVAEYNDVHAMRAALEAGPPVAAVILEPIAANMGVVPPLPGYLEEVRRITQAAGALLIFDEVISGFRVARGGAQELYGISPDLTCLGKIVGGGLPVGAVGGRGELMDLLAPAGPVYQAGTLSGNPVACSAGLATLGLLTGEAYAALEKTSALLADGLRDAIASAGVHATVQRVGSLLTLFFGVDQVRNFTEASTSDTVAFARFFRAMIERGVYLPPSQFEAWFLSLAHGAAEVERIVEGARAALRA